MTKDEWGGRAEFAEEAEALGVCTDQIISRRWDDETLMVLFFRSEGGREIVWGATLCCDPRGILRVESATSLEISRMEFEQGLKAPDA